MNQNMTTSIDKRSQRLTRRGLSVMLAILATLALMTTVAFAETGGDSYREPAEVSSVSSRGWVIRADANPSMDVAAWYAPAAASTAASNRGWAIRADANPSMDVAAWYAPEAASTIVSNRGWAIRADANPSMDVALWYGPAVAGQECIAC